jgi:ribosomal protein S18
MNKEYKVIPIIHRLDYCDYKILEKYLNDGWKIVRVDISDGFVYILEKDKSE